MNDPDARESPPPTFRDHLLTAGALFHDDTTAQYDLAIRIANELETADELQFEQQLASHMSAALADPDVGKMSPTAKAIIAAGAIGNGYTAEQAKYLVDTLAAVQQEAAKSLAGYILRQHQRKTGGATPGVATEEV